MVLRVRQGGELRALIRELGHRPAGGALGGIGHVGGGGGVEDVDAAMLEVIPMMDVAMNVGLHLRA